jgi:hypothetical protein
MIGAMGKAAFVILTFFFAMSGEVPLSTALSTLPDLFFATIFVYHLGMTRISRHDV